MSDDKPDLSVIAVPIWIIAFLLWLMMMQNCAPTGTERGSFSRPVYVDVKGD